MPVTVRTCDFGAETWSPPKQGTFTSDNSEILRSADITEFEKSKQVLQCTTSKTASPTPIVASPNGFLGGIIDAWRRHHNLVLRPEDFWFVIVSQLSFYINANSEALRSYFVAHQGKKKLVVEQEGTIETVDYGIFANMMTEEIRRNVKDPELKDWVMPNFTTTTDEDRIVGAVLFMGAMQQYFEYYFDCTSCGVPKITLLGEKLDWVKIQDRLPKLLLWGDQAAEYYKYLTPIFKYIVATFDDPTSNSVVSFWKKMVMRHGPDADSGGKNANFMTGWVSGMFLWNADGTVREEARGPSCAAGMDGVTLDGVGYHMLYLDSYLIPAVGSVPVTVREFDEVGNIRRIIETRMMAGICGFEPCELPQHLPMGPTSSASSSKTRVTSFGLRNLLGGLLIANRAEKAGSKSKAKSTPDKGTSPTQQKVPDVGAGPTIDSVKLVSFWWIYEVPPPEEDDK